MPNYDKDKAAKFWRKLSHWSQEIFGLDSVRGPEGPLKHLIKEVNETFNALAHYDVNPTKETSDKVIEEFADCLFLIFDAARRAGFKYNNLLKAAFDKLEKNKSRKWPKPTTNEPVEHIRE